jgi:hypothetical protein
MDTLMDVKPDMDLRVQVDLAAITQLSPDR